MNVPELNRTLGDYQLKELVLETPLAYRWLAEQISVGRQVLVDELKPEMVNQRAEFLANVRAKAGTRHPLIASVYEAVDEEANCYYAHEHLPGGSLEARKQAGEPLKPGEIAHLLSRIAKVHMQFDEQGQSTSPMTLEHVHLDAHGVLRLDNLVTHHERTGKEVARDMGFLGRALAPLVVDGQPGTTRVFTLLRWMRGEDIEQPLVWAQVVELCERIEQQLSGISPASVPVQEVEGKDPKRPMALIAMAGLLAMMVVLIIAVRMRPEAASRNVVRPELPEPVAIAASPLVMADGRPSEVAGFRMAAHEVTIAEYAEFLGILKTLAASERHTIFDHREQPDAKTSHQPDDWAALHQAAKAGGVWKGRSVTVDCPVVGVDWWDAMAYCEWKHGRLPRQEEWVLASGLDPRQSLQWPGAGWGPVDPATSDRSSRGVLNMAGSVSEWSLSPTVNPVNPMSGKMWLILGGSYLQDGGHALTLEWVDDRGLRRPDLGFRVVFDVE